MIRTLLTGLMLLSLSACAMAPALPPEPPENLSALLRHTEIEGDTQTRNDAQTNRQLWNFAGEVEAALARANHDKDLIAEQIHYTPPKASRCMSWAKAIHLCK